MAKQSEIWAWNRESVKKEDWTNDFQTPPAVCDYMASLIPVNAKRILEPTPGNGNLVGAIIRADSALDITAPEDYFLLDQKQRFDCVIMNPPFSSRYTLLDQAPAHLHKSGMRVGYEILKQCMKMSPDIIALMPWFTLSDSDIRLRHLKNFGMVSLTALPRKTFQYARIQTVVIQLSEGWIQPTIFKYFDFPKPVLPSLFDL